MKIESVDMFYLAMPEILDIGDGSQDMCLVRVRTSNAEGWGECEASPLPTIAALVAPMSHLACHNVADSVIGQQLSEPSDIARIAAEVGHRSLDLLQADHTWSGIEMALWDLLGKVLERPVFELLGQGTPVRKVAYASQLFGADPAETFEKAKSSVAAGYQAVKFGWGPYGYGSVQADADHVHAAREGIGSEARLMVDAGTVFVADVDAAALRLPALIIAQVTWFEEPFVSGALGSYAALAASCAQVPLAGGEGAHNSWIARHIIDHGGVGYIQIDTGRIGGIGPAVNVAKHAHARGIHYVNHTFTSQLALSASLQPFADSATDVLCEYPVEAQPLARRLTTAQIEVDRAGSVIAPSAPGLGLDVDAKAVSEYLLDIEIVVGGKVLYRTPDLS